MSWTLSDLPMFATLAPTRRTRRSDENPETRLLRDVLHCGQSREVAPPLNVYGDESEIAIRVELPGVPRDAVEVRAEENLVVLEVTRPDAELPEGAAYRRRERPVESVRRSVEIPFRFDADKITASYERGILEVRVPRAEADRPRRIEIAKK